MTDQEILLTAREQLKADLEETDENRKMALDDLTFIAEDKAQWPALIRAEREANGQPCLTINKLPVFVDQVVGDQRMNRPSIKVNPVDSIADPETARILGGWVKHVQHISRSDVAIDHGFEHMVVCGQGALRVITDYESDVSFNQEAYIKKIDNALAVVWGKHTEYDCSDADHCFIITDMPKNEYKSKYGLDPMPFNEADSQYVAGWVTKDTVRLAEYFQKVETKKKLYLLDDGRTTYDIKAGDSVVKSRMVKSYTIMWYLLSGNKVIDKKVWPGKKYIPVIPIWGKELNVGGKRIIRGLVRNGKDAQRMYNYWQSCDTETVALQPRAPYMVTPKMIEGFETMWNTAGKKNNFYLLVNPDKDAPGIWPQRQTPPQASSAMVEKIQMADQEMRDTMGLQRASLGMQSNERSGAAIRERKQEGDVGTFAFIDNLARSIEHLGRVLIDIAPTILDTERIIRLGLDNGEFEFKKVNDESTEEGKKLFDMSVGTYDVTVTVGPSFTTQRTEARESMKEFIQYYPAAAPVIGDLYAKVQDWPGADEVAERLEFLIPPEIKAKLDERKAKKEGKQVEVNTPQQPPPDPLVVLKIQVEQQKLEEGKIKLAQEQEVLKGLQIKNEQLVNESQMNIRRMVDEILNEKLKSSNQTEME